MKRRADITRELVAQIICNLNLLLLSRRGGDYKIRDDDNRIDSAKEAKDRKARKPEISNNGNELSAKQIK